MASLADFPELVGFFSYSRDDDEDSKDALSGLRELIQRELRGQLGRSRKELRLWQDKGAIAAGKLWETEIRAAIEQSVFFIPIVTPTVVKSPVCRIELDLFLAREVALGRSDLVFPILYIRVPGLEDEYLRRNDPVLSIIAQRQYVDWREFRHRDVNSWEVREAVEKFCAYISEALRAPWLSPEERKEREDAAARAKAEEEQRRQEKEAERERQRREAEAQAERKRQEAEPHAARKKAEAETRVTELPDWIESAVPEQVPPLRLYPERPPPQGFPGRSGFPERQPKAAQAAGAARARAFAVVWASLLVPASFAMGIIFEHWELWWLWGANRGVTGATLMIAVFMIVGASVAWRRRAHYEKAEKIAYPIGFILALVSVLSVIAGLIK